MDLASKLVDPRATPFLYGTTPAREGSAATTIQTAAAKLAERVRHLPLDGFVVYDLQDESLRTDLERPFPFVRTVDSRVYSQLLTRLSGVPAVTYKCIGMLGEAEWRGWLDETADAYGVSCLSLVGHPTSRGAPWPMTLARAFQLAGAHRAGFTLGGGSDRGALRRDAGRARRAWSRRPRAVPLLRHAGGLRPRGDRAAAARLRWRVPEPRPRAVPGRPRSRPAAARRP